MSLNAMKTEIVLKEHGSERKHPIQLPCVLGRTKAADLSFSDPTVSHRHALISFEDGEVWIEDLQSANGVHINGRKITGKTPLERGDTILLGRTALYYLPEDEESFDETVILHSMEHSEDCRLDQQRLKLINEIASQLAENQDLSTLQRNLTSRFKDIFKHDRGYVALFREDGSLESILPESPAESVPISRTILNRLFERGESFLLADALGDLSLKDQDSILAFKIRSALCAPLMYHGHIYGVVYLDRDVPGAYNEDDLELLRTIALIVAPLIENARLWSELKRHYGQAMETLKETQAKLIETEREAAYMRLAQAMAHEIRNPLMGIGGMVRRMSQGESDLLDRTKLKTVLDLVERVESFMKEVDDFVKLPPPEQKLERIDSVIQRCMEEHEGLWSKQRIRPVLVSFTPRVMVPLDAELFSQAVSMIFREIFPSLSQGSDLNLSLVDSGKDIEVVIGEVREGQCTSEIYDKDMQRKAWTMALYLNIAHKIICDHGGKMLFDPEANSPHPLVIRLPRSMKMKEAPHMAERPHWTQGD
ncbi:MAG: FHA domain-containing protein [Syntrophobacteraceae bacterium]|nr:FHA domain-containing protein [Syntrophobacteraceae bacterium]